MINRSNAFSAKKQSKIESLKAQLQSEEDSQIYPTPHISEKTNQIGIALISSKIYCELRKHTRSIHDPRKAKKVEYNGEI